MAKLEIRIAILMLCIMFITASNIDIDVNKESKSFDIKTDNASSIKSNVQSASIKEDVLNVDDSSLVSGIPELQVSDLENYDNESKSFDNKTDDASSIKSSVQGDSIKEDVLFVDNGSFLSGIPELQLSSLENYDKVIVFAYAKVFDKKFFHRMLLKICLVPTKDFVGYLKLCDAKDIDKYYHENDEIHLYANKKIILTWIIDRDCVFPCLLIGISLDNNLEFITEVQLHDTT